MNPSKQKDSMVCIIRAAKASDCNVLANLMNQLDSKITSADMLERINFYEHDKFYNAWVAEHDGIVIGCIAGVVTEIFSCKGRVMHINTLIVEEKHRRQGIGTLLVESAEAFAMARGCCTIELLQNESHKTNKFYESLGYKDIYKDKKLMVKKMVVFEW